LIENSNLITRTIFPSEVVSIAIFLSSLLNHLLALGLAIVVIALWLGHLSLWILMLPVYMVMIGLFSIGLGWIVSSLQVYLRDTSQLVTVALTLWFWTTPIMIDDAHYPRKLRFLLTLNPFSYLVRGYRDGLLSFRMPGTGELLTAAAYSVGAFIIGGLFFRQMKRGFADVL
jgi:ABC-type polysaccharide/polyol phosphate export permease